MAAQDFSGNIHAGKPTADPCDSCLKADGSPTVVGSVKILLKTWRKRLCLDCAKELVSLVELRIAQAKKGEFQA